MKTIRLEVDDLFEDISKPSLSIIGPDYKVIVLYRDPRAIMTSITLRWSTCRLRFFSWPLDHVIYLNLRIKLLLLKSTQYKNLANHMKKWNKEHQTLGFLFFIKKSSILMLFVLFFHVVCMIWDFKLGYLGDVRLCEPQSI